MPYFKSNRLSLPPMPYFKSNRLLCPVLILYYAIPASSVCPNPIVFFAPSDPILRHSRLFRVPKSNRLLLLLP